MQFEIVHGDCLKVLSDRLPNARCLFADPPDNLGLKYSGVNDRRRDYAEWLKECMLVFASCADVIWLSFNSRWMIEVAAIAGELRDLCGWDVKPCVQTFTFGQHCHTDFANCHRPLWRFSNDAAPWNTDAIRVRSWRQEHGDSRADDRGRVPGDVFDFPRVTGNSKQRRSWHPTQLNEGLVERCILSCTQPGDLVIDPFLGTGTTARVCKRINRDCLGIELSEEYFDRVRQEFDLECHGGYT